MKKITFESLPNELLLMIFSYLSFIDLCQLFLDLKNARLERLLTSKYYSLDLSSIYFNQLRQFLSSSNDKINRLSTLIDTVVICDSSAGWMLLKHWIETFIDTELSNTRLPSIKKLFILNADYFQHYFIKSFFPPLISVSNTLQYLHLVFETPTFYYPSVLSELIRHHISVHTMILEVENGHEFYPNELKKDLHKMESLYWPNTVQLTLSIQYPSELVLLLKRDALPAIEHLNITNEQIHTVFPLRRYIPVSNIHLCDYNLREIADGTRLRSLLLRYLSLSDIILLIDSLTMPLLEKLILIDLYDD
ncbi:unnamed protein product, partial [Rotaria sordida]